MKVIVGGFALVCGMAFLFCYPIYVWSHRSAEEIAGFKVNKPVAFDALPAEKRARKIIPISSAVTPGGQVESVAMLTYEDGHREECTFRMVLDPVDGGVTVTPQSRICKAATN
jgi:hypothetical protein